MFGFLELSVVVILACGVIAGLVFGSLKVWNFIVATRRTHRLQREQDERDHRKALADDYAASLKQLDGIGTMDFADYSRKNKKESYEPRTRSN